MKKVLVVLVVLVAGLLLYGLADIGVPIAAEEPQFQEPQTILEYLQSSPRGQELLKYLYEHEEYEELLNMFANTPYVLPKEAQPVVYGGSCDAKLTEEEARRHKIGAQEKPAYLREGLVIKTREGDIICLGIQSISEVYNMDAEAIKAVQIYLSKFDYSADLDGDGYINKAECIAWVENYFHTGGLL